MFESLQMAPPDAILGLTEAFKSDPRAEKINLSVGVYQDQEGHTPILDCVRQAEQRLLESRRSKSYLPIAGTAAFGQTVRKLVFGADHCLATDGRAATLQTPGGTGACRLAGDFLAQKLGVRRIWCSNPTWANHPGIFEAAGLRVETYPYLDAAGNGLDLDAMLSALQAIAPGEAVCLHGCCHNPSGIDPTLDQWRDIARVVADRQLLPLVDFAYQGLGDGLAEDAAGVVAFCQIAGKALIATSFSKNFGLYSERTGALTIVGSEPPVTEAALSHAKRCARTSYSNPPEHGAAIVTTVLGDAALCGLWHDELAAMRDRINHMRRRFADTMQAKGSPRDFSFITRQRGMFSFSGLTPLQVDQLRTEHAIYIVRSGRINVAGMTEANMDRLCDAILSVL